MEEGISLKEIFQILFKFKWVLLIANIIIFAVSLFIVMLIKPEYKSKGSILINVSVKDTIQNSNQGAVLVKTIDSYTKTDIVKYEIITKLNLDTTVEKFYQNYDFSTSIDNYIITFECKSKEKEDNREIVNTTISIIKENEEYFDSLFNEDVVLNNIDILEYSNYYYQVKTSRMLYLTGLTMGLGVISALVVLAYSYFSDTFDVISELERYLKSKKIEDIVYQKDINYKDLYVKITNYQRVYIVDDNREDIDIFYDLLVNSYGFNYDNLEYKKSTTIVKRISQTQYACRNYDRTNLDSTLVIFLVTFKGLTKKELLPLITESRITKTTFIIN